jgi:photosystem II stability/assembly factor-like uncharacterized protein
MMKGCWKIMRQWAMAAALLPVLAACGSSAEEGVLPEGPPAGEVVALSFDAAGKRLLKAHPHALNVRESGETAWEPIPLPTSVQQGRIAAVAAREGALYIAGPDVGVMRSEDEGRTWVRVDEELPGRDIRAFAVHADQPRTLYAAIPEEGIYRSEDAGETWTRMDGGPDAPIRQLFHSDMAGSMQTGWLFAATPEGVRRSMDCFCGWRPTGELPAGEIRAITYDPTDPAHVYAATSVGLYRSTNGGEEWERMADGANLSALAFNSEADALVTATRDGALLRSVDQGRTWERVGA